MTWKLDPDTGTFVRTKARRKVGKDYPSRESAYRREYHQRKYREDPDYRARVQERELLRRQRALGIPEPTRPTSACEICGRTDNGLTKTGSPRRMHIDHDHATGLFRGWLCNLCNSGIGMFKDDPALLEAAIRYLRERK